jgi:putative transposase
MQERKHLRLKEYDYSSDGIYFVTICVIDNEKLNKNDCFLFGDVNNGKMELNRYGRIVKECWEDLPNHYHNCKLDVYVVMPNHFHGIIIIDNTKNMNAENKQIPFNTEGLKENRENFPFESSENISHPNKIIKRYGLPEIIRAFKSFSARRINEIIKNKQKFHWQKSYYDHIIRTEQTYINIGNYIVNNPLQWEEDIENINKVNKNRDEYYKRIFKD